MGPTMKYIDNYTNEMLQLRRDEKLYVQFMGEREYLYSGWEINQITSQLNNLYYKNEIVNTIKSYLKEGAQANSIIIMNDSIKLNNSYSKYEGGYLNLNDDEHLQNFYHLGSPVAFMNNEKVKRIYILFELVRSLYSNNKDSNLKFKNQKKFLKSLIENRNNFTSGELLSNFIYNMLKDVNKYEIQEDADIAMLIDRKIKSLKNFFNSWNQTFENDYNTRKDSKDFKYYFRRLGKPIVCIYDEDTHSIKLLCIDMIAMQYFKEDNSRLLETKEIKQNSPLIITVGIAMTFLPSLLKLGENVWRFTKTKKEYDEEELSLDQEAETTSRELSETEELILRNKNLISANPKILDQDIFLTGSTNDEKVDVSLKKVEDMNSEMISKFRDTLQSKDVKVTGI